MGRVQNTAGVVRPGGFWNPTDLSACAAPDSVRKSNLLKNAVRSIDADRFSELMTCHRPPAGGPDSVKKNQK